MKIAFSAFVMQGGKSGVASYVINLLEALQAQDAANDYDVLLPRGEQDLVRITSPRFRKTPVADALSKPVPNIAWHNLALPLRSRRERYDLLHVPSYRRLPYVRGTRVVATVHDLATFHIEGKYDAARMFFNRRIVPAMIRRAHRIITVSRFTRDDIVRLIGYPADRITVIYSGIHRDAYRPVPPDAARAMLAARYGIRTPYLVFVSRLEHPAKNHVRLIDAFERIKARGRPDLKLVLAGADWNGADAIRARAAASPAATDIVFAGFVPLADLPAFYSGCELAVYPSLFEGFGFPVVEALACGAPAACSNTSSLAEIGPDLVPKFDPRDPAGMADAIEAALRRGRPEALTEAGRAYAATFDWADTASRTIEVYRQTVEDRP